MKKILYRQLASMLAIGLATVSSTAAAQSVGGSASASNFAYQLFDLDLTDGITPSLSFVESIYSESITYSYSTGQTTSDRRDDYGATSVLNSIGSVSTLASAQSKHAELTLAPPDGGSTYASTGNYSILAFTLSPSTGVRFTLSAHADSYNGSYGDIYSRVSLTGKIEDEDVLDWSRDSYFADALRADGRSLDAKLSGYFESERDARAGRLWIATAVDATARTIPAVPEPQTYLMMLAGVALLAGVRKRSNG